MTNRERILTILDGGVPDRIPWIPRLQIWYEANRRQGTLPPRYREMTLREVERDVFGGTAARDGVIYRSEITDVEIRRHTPSDKGDWEKRGKGDRSTCSRVTVRLQRTAHPRGRECPRLLRKWSQAALRWQSNARH